MRQVPRLIQEVGKGKVKPDYMKLIDEIISLSEDHDDNEVVDALCYIITVTKDHNVISQALDIISRINGR